MAVRLVERRQLDPPIDRPLWRAQKGQRSAQAVVRLIPNAGLELRIEVDGNLRWSRCCGWNTRELDAEAEHKRRALQRRGWADEPLTQLEQCGWLRNQDSAADVILSIPRPKAARGRVES